MPSYKNLLPGYSFIWDFDGLVNRLYGAIPHDAKPNKGEVPHTQNQ
jgi:hypothetical protein